MSDLVIQFREPMPGQRKERERLTQLASSATRFMNVPNIRASFWIVRFRSLFLFLFSAFVLPRFTVSIAPHIQNRWILTFSLPVVLHRRFISALILLPVDNARKILPLQRCRISPPGSDLILVDARRAYQRCCTSAWALSSCARNCRESVDGCSSLAFWNSE